MEGRELCRLAQAPPLGLGPGLGEFDTTRIEMAARRG